MATHFSQAFRAKSSQEITNIPTRMDRIGLHVILWNEIRHVFPGAKTILNKREVVFFEADDNFAYLTPLRIAYQPGVVLTVITDTSNNANTDSEDQAIELVTETSSQQSRAASWVSSPSVDDEKERLYEKPDDEDTPARRTQPIFMDEPTDVEVASQPESLSANTEGDPLHTSQRQPPMEPQPQPLILNSIEQDMHEPGAATLADIGSVSQPDNLSILGVASPAERMIAVQSGFTTVYVQPSIHGYRQLCNSYIDAANNGQLTQATAIADAMNALFEDLQTELAYIRDTQKQVAQGLEVRRGQAETRQHVAEEVAEHPGYPQQHPEGRCYQQQPIDIQQERDDQQQEQQQPIQQPIQQQAPSELSPEIRDCILSVITQNYELHEYQFPRLFIVLPKEIRGANKITKSTVVSCRLYFLCECGAHTTPEKCTTPHHVHVANHQGYDIVKPDEFFQKYGRYVLAQMYMIKYGVMASTLNVPPLGSGTILEWLDTAQEHLGFIRKNMDQLVNESIEFLQDLTRNSDDGVTNGDDVMRLDKIEVMEGAHRRVLRWYLNVENNDRCFGGLHRIITPEGHVKWVCKDHNLADDPRTDAQPLAEMESYGEVFDTELREVTFKRGWNSGSRYIERIQKFRITLTQQTANTFDLIESVSNANVVDLAVDEFSNRIYLCYCGSLASLMSNGKLQTLRILSIDSRPPWHNLKTTAPKMRVVEFQGPLLEDSSTMFSLEGFLGYCPNLVYLGLRLQDQSSLVNFLTTVIPKLKNLKCLELYYGKYYLSANITQGKIKTLRMHLPFTKHIIFQDTKIPEYSQVLDETLALKQLADILRQYPSIDDIKFRYQELEIRDIIDASARQWTPSGCSGNTSPPRTLVLRHGLGHHNPLLNTVAVAFGGTGMDTHVRIGQSDKTSSLKYTEIFCHYGWSFRTLSILNGSFDDHLALLLDQSTRGSGSRIQSLVVDMKSLSAVGLNFVDQVIRRSNDLEELTVICSTSDILRIRESAYWFLTQPSQRRLLMRFCLRGGVLARDEWKRILEAIDLSTMEQLDFQDTNFSSEEFRLLVSYIEGQGLAPPLKTLHLKGTDFAKSGPVALKEKLKSTSVVM